MSNVKIKKSVLQSIIKKSLSESGLHSDPSRRLVVGPDSSSLPSMLPLTPSDRMSTQLEVERPPVEDPEYVPMNSKELGYALQALAEMIPVDNVAEAYRDFQDVIEKINDEGQKDDELDHMGGAPDFEDKDEDMSVDAQLESIRRKNKRFDALLREANVGSKRGSLRGQSKSSKSNEDPEALAALARMKDYKPKADEDPKTRKEQMAAFGKWLVRKGITTPTTRQGFSDKFKEFLRDEKYQLPGREDVAAMMRDKSNDEPGDRFGDLSDPEKFRPSNTSSVFQILQRYPEVCDSYNIQSLQAGLLADLVGLSLTKDELETFLKTINDNFLNDSAMKKEWRTAFKGGINDASILADFIKKFSDDDMISKKPEDEKLKDFNWRDNYKKFGYAAESGLRQAFVGDVNARFELRHKILSEPDEEKVYEILSNVFKDAITDNSNQPLLKQMFDEEGLDEYTDWADTAEHEELLASELYRNFIGSINRDIMGTLAEQSFVDADENDTRPLGAAFMRGFPQYSPPTDDEEDQLEGMAAGHAYLNQLKRFLKQAAVSNYKNTLAAAALLSAQEFDAEEFGGYTTDPAFTSLRKHSGYKKPPEYALKDYIDADTPEGAELLNKIKLGNKESEALAKAKAEKSKPSTPVAAPKPKKPAATPKSPTRKI